MKGHKYFLDTNIFIRVIAKDDFHKVDACETLFRLILDGKLSCLTSSIVLAELVWTLMSFYKIRKFAVIRVLKSILAMKHLNIVDDYNILYALELYENHKVKFIDAIIASSQSFQKDDMKIISYDRDYDKLGIQRVEPQYFIHKNKTS